MLRPIHEQEIGRPAGLDQAAIEGAHPGGVAGGAAEQRFGRHVADRGQQRDHAQDSQRLDARSGGAVGAEDHAPQLPEIAGVTQRRQPGEFVAVVHDLDAAGTALAQTADLRQRQRGVAAVDVADDVGVRLQHRVGIDIAGSGNGRATGVDGALDARLAGPGDHLLRLVPGLDAAQADFAQQPHPGPGKLGKIGFHHALFEHRRAGQDFHAGRTKVVVGALGGDGERLDADDVPVGGLGDALRRRRPWW